MAKSPDETARECRQCQGDRRFFVDWSLVRGRAEQTWARLDDSLEESAARPFGALFECVECGGLWVLERSREKLYAVPSGLSDLARRWFAQDVSLSGKQLQDLERIGMLGPGLYDNPAGQARAPCVLEWSDGRIADPSIVVVGDLPPLDPSEVHVELFQDVRYIRKSEFALTRRIRRMTRRAKEIRMGFAPTAVAAGRGSFFVLNGVADVFSHGGFRGKDVRLPRLGGRRRSRYPVVDEPTGLVTFVYAREAATSLAAQAWERCSE
ncbi:MAG: hypothetical protein GY722_14970 [bacterium]|nr:hypothetical protein [bacterium]